jgi:hypothetical protein
MNLKRLHGPPLFNIGYKIIPIRKGKKFPTLKGWQKLKANKQDVLNWIKNPYCGGFGVLGEFTPGIDIDIQDEKIVNKIVKWCHENIGWAPVRRGNAPRALLPCCPPEAGLGPDYSAKFIDVAENTHQIEIKATGQQWVAYGIHPKTKKEYFWEKEELYNVAPDWLPELTGTKIHALFDYFYSIVPDHWEKKSVDKREKFGGLTPDGRLSGNLSFENYTPPLNIETDKVKAILSKLDPDGNINGLGWRSVGMALYHQFEGSEEGFKIFDEWSQRSKEYDRKEIDARWPSWGSATYAGKPLTMATIIHMYNTIMDETEDPTLIRKPKKLTAWEKRWAIVELTDGTEVHDTGVPLYKATRRTLRAFKEQNAGYLYNRLNPDGTFKTMPMVDAWSASLNTRHYSGYTYQPGKSRFCPREFSFGDNSLYVNTFYFPPHKEIVCGLAIKKLSVFFDFLKHLFPEKEERYFIVQWLARMIKNPETRSFVTPINVTPCTGTGRGLFFEILRSVLGSHNCHDVSRDDLEGRFNSFMDKCILAVVQEIKTATGERKYQMWERMKSLLADTTTNIQQKGKDSYTATIYANFLMFSNNLDALPIPDEKERRIYAMRGAINPPTVEYIDRILEWKKDTENIAALFWWLKSQNVDNSLFKRAPMTETKKQMILLTHGTNFTNLTDWLYYAAPEVFDYDYISEELEKFSGDMEGVGISRKMMRRALADRGYHSTQLRLKEKRVYVYYDPTITKPDPEILRKKYNISKLSFLD